MDARSGRCSGRRIQRRRFIKSFDAAQRVAAETRRTTRDLVVVVAVAAGVGMKRSSETVTDDRRSGCGSWRRPGAPSLFTRHRDSHSAQYRQGAST
jgi:hypothetical protein